MSDFELYWPTVDNIYVIRTATKSGDFTSQLINCRFKRGYKAKPNSASKPRAASTKKAKHHCNVSFRLVNALLKHVQADITKGYAPAAVIGSIRGSGQL
ncbi:hypothetical protein B0O99DRAFT_647104, partial [Bisporella sp. PMI_857]